MMIRRPLLWALTLSVLLHACWLVDVEWAWPWQKQLPDQVLATKKADAVKRVRLAAKAKVVRSDILKVTLLAPASESPAATDKTRSPEKPATKKVVVAATPVP